MLSFPKSGTTCAQLAWNAYARLKVEPKGFHGLHSATNYGRKELQNVKDEDKSSRHIKQSWNYPIGVAYE